MEKRYYLDTSIWRDYFENRSDKFRPLGEWAFTFIKKVIQNNDLILYSDFIIMELKVSYSDKQIKDIFEIAREQGLLLKVDISKPQVKEAARLAKEKGVAFGDALHAILARDNKAIMITRDKHFYNLQDIVNIKKPEELI